MVDQVRMRDGLRWAGYGLVASIAYWFVCGIVFYFLDEHADKQMETHPWLQLLFGVGLVAAFALPALLSASEFDGMTWRWMLLALLLVAIPAFGPVSTGAMLGGLVVTALLAGLFFWLGARPAARGRRAYFDSVGTNVSYAAAIPALVIAGALLVMPNHASGFCSTHSCEGNFDHGQGSIVQCEDGTYSHSGGVQGACSWHGGVASGF
jgi:hypothetical protein